MKYVVIIPDGAAEQPVDSLGGKTPLEVAHTPAMDRVSKLGVLGQAEYVPAGMPVGSDVAIMGLLGLNPRDCYQGRGSIEALGREIDLQADQWAVRCNLITLEEGQLQDPTAGAISDDEASQLIEFANQQLADPELRLVAGVGYRNLLIVSGEKAKMLSADLRLLSPNDLTGQSILDAFPRGPNSELLCELTDLSAQWFADHPVNQQRKAAGLAEATCLWFWGQGQTPRCQPFEETFGKTGSLIAAVDVVNGLGKIVGLSRVTVPTATGMPNTDYAAKGQAACRMIDQSDLVIVHVEAPDEAAHQGDAAAKIAALEAIDREIVAPLLSRLEQESSWRMLISPDHQTSSQTRRHQPGPVCFAAAGSGIAADDWTRFCEQDAESSSLKFRQGWTLMPWFLGS